MLRLMDVERAMDELVAREFDEGVFLATLRAGRYTLVQLRYFAAQYSYYSRHFPRVLGAAIAAMEPEAAWWVPLADNLWDEAGRGTPGREHEALYRTFWRSLDPSLRLDERGFPPVPMSPAVEWAVTTFLTFFRAATPMEALAAVGLGSEYFAGRVMGAIADGLRHPAYQAAGGLDLRFWDVHADAHEPRHYALCRSLLERYRTPEELRRLYEVGARIARSEAKMYTDLHREMACMASATPT